MALGLRLPEQQRWQVPYGIGALVFVVAVVLFFVGAYVSRRRPVSLLYAVCLVYPFVMAISPRSYGTIDPHYVSSLMPVFALLVAQLARNAVSEALVLLAGAALSFGWVHDSYEKLQHGHPISSSLPRSIDPLIATLDRLHVDRVYTTYWIAYRLDFESRERIIAVENKFDRLTVRDGVLEPGPDPFVRYAPYEHTLRASNRHAFVFLMKFQPSRGYVAQLHAHGYTPHDVQTFVVYAASSRPPRRSAVAHWGLLAARANSTVSLAHARTRTRAREGALAPPPVTASRSSTCHSSCSRSPPASRCRPRSSSKTARSLGDPYVKAQPFRRS